MRRIVSLTIFSTLLTLLPTLLSCQAQRSGEGGAPAQPTPVSRPTAAISPPPNPVPGSTATPPASSPAPEETPETQETPEPESPPVTGSWSVSLTESKDSGKSYHSGNSVKVSSDGTVIRTHWQNGIAGPQPRSVESKVPPEELMELRVALGHPRLYRGHAAVGNGETVLEITREGKTRTFRTERSSFVGPPGKVQQALLSIGTGQSPTASAEFTITFEQPATDADVTGWESRTFSLDSNGEATCTYNKPSPDISGRHQVPVGQATEAQLENLKSGVGRLRLGDPPGKVEPNPFKLIFRKGEQTYIFTSKDGSFPAEAGTLLKLMKSSFPGGPELESLIWRPATASP